METKKDDTLIALKDPKIGDVYTEFYSFFVYVLGRNDTVVTYMEANSPCELPKDGKTHTSTLEDFNAKFTYDRIDGSWVRLINRGKDIVPSWAVEYMKEYNSRPYVLSKYKKDNWQPVITPDRFVTLSNCPYYPCHKVVGMFNCKFCFCPFHHLTDCPGSYRMDGDVKDCSECTYPHEVENLEEIYTRLKVKLYSKK
jgi:Zn-finger protein